MELHFLSFRVKSKYVMVVFIYNFSWNSEQFYLRSKTNLFLVLESDFAINEQVITLEG